MLSVNTKMNTGADYLANLLGTNGQDPVDKDKDTVEIQIPEWFETDRFRRGQQFYRDHLTSMYSAMFMGLLSILAIPSILKVLMTTGSSTTSLGAYRRYVKTIYHVLAWHEHDLSQNSLSWQSISMVRKTHLNVKKFCEKSKNITITQRDMAITQFGFMGFTILRSRMLGIHTTDESTLEDTVHFWRVLGYMMGIKDECNLCTDTLVETRARLEALLSNVIRPALENTDTNFTHMTWALVNGMCHYVYHMQYSVVLYLAKRCAGCDGYEYFENEFRWKEEVVRSRLEYRKLGMYARAKVGMFVLLHEFLLKFDICRHFMNSACRLSRLMSFYLPITAIFQYGAKQAYVRIFPSKKKSQLYR